LAVDFGKLFKLRSRCEKTCKRSFSKTFRGVGSSNFFFSLLADVVVVFVGLGLADYCVGQGQAWKVYSCDLFLRQLFYFGLIFFLLDAPLDQISLAQRALARFRYGSMGLFV